MLSLVILIVAALLCNCVAFTPSSQRAPLRTKTSLEMGGKMSKFGIFSPAVYAAKFILGTVRNIKIIMGDFIISYDYRCRGGEAE